MAVSAGAALSEPVKLRGVQYIGDLPTLIADGQGFFETSGQDIEVSYGKSGKANLAALRKGEIDYGLMAMTPFVLDRMRDPSPGGVGDPVILANLTHGAPNIRIIARQDPLMPAGPGPRSLEGRRIGLPKGTNAEYLWSLFAAFHGIDVQSIDLVDLGPEQIVEAFNAGEIGAAIVWEPWDHSATLVNDRNLTTHDDALFNFYASRWILVARRSDPARTRRHRDVLGAYVAAVDWIQGHPGPAARHFRDAWEIGDSAAPGALLGSAIFNVTLDWSLFASYRQQLEWARWAGYPVHGGTGSFLSAIETAPLRSVSPASVLLPRLSPGTGKQEQE